MIVCTNIYIYIYIYIYIIVEKSPNSSHMYDHGFMDNTNRQAVKNWLDSQTRDASLTSWRQPFCDLQNGCLHDVRDASLVCESSQFLTAWRLVLSMKPWSYIWLEFGLFSTIIAIIRACACWALFVVTLTNTVHLIYIYIYLHIYNCIFRSLIVDVTCNYVCWSGKWWPVEACPSRALVVLCRMLTIFACCVLPFMFGMLFLLLTASLGCVCPRILIFE